MTRVTFMVPFAYAMGGIPRTTFMVANELVARGHEVSLISALRTQPEPFFHLDPSIERHWLMDEVDPEHPGRKAVRPRAKHDRLHPVAGWLDRRPTTLSEDSHQFFSRLTDLKLRRLLRTIPDGVVVATRPELAIASVRWTKPSVITVMQEHLSIVERPDALREATHRMVAPGSPRRLGAFLTLTEAELEKWRPILGETDIHLGVIPNATPFEVGDPAPLAAKRVVAAGRLVHQKGFERLVAAWAPIARSHPDWALDIYGEGPREGTLRQQIEDLGIGSSVTLRGLSDDIQGVLRDASAYAMSSRFEGLPMVLLEAMSQGVPPVSFDCPEGPRQLIDDGRTGLLVPADDIEGLSAALLRVIEDAGLRHRLGAGALESARQYGIGPVTDRWERLFEELAAARAR